MSLWSFRNKAKELADTGQVQKSWKTVKYSPPVSVEVKVLAIDALEAVLSTEEVRESAGAFPATIHE